MTSKEKIYAQILETRNAIDKLNGNAPRYDIDKCLRTNYAQTHTRAELNTELGIAQSCLRNTRSKKAIENGTAHLPASPTAKSMRLKSKAYGAKS